MLSSTRADMMRQTRGFLGFHCLLSKWSASVVMIATASILLHPNALQSNAEQFSCHLRELELCGVGLASLFQNPNGIPDSNQDMKRQCEYMKESTSCFEQFNQRCSSHLHLYLVQMFSNDSLGMLDEFCTKDSPFQREYLAQASCLRKFQLKYQRSCVQDLQVGFESIHRLALGVKLSTACCNVNRFKSCILDKLEENCGQQALDLVQSILERTLGKRLSLVCRSYEPAETTCVNLLPPTDSKPHTGRNTSVISRVISSYANSH